MIAACAMPTAWVLVMATGPENVPDSSIQDTPVISPLPFWEKKPAATGSPAPARDQRPVAHLDAGHVSDGVPPSRHPAERDLQGPGARPARRRGCVRPGRPCGTGARGSALLAGHPRIQSGSGREGDGDVAEAE